MKFNKLNNIIIQFIFIISELTLIIPRLISPVYADWEPFNIFAQSIQQGKTGRIGDCENFKYSNSGYHLLAVEICKSIAAWKRSGDCQTVEFKYNQPMGMAFCLAHRKAMEAAVVAASVTWAANAAEEGGVDVQRSVHKPSCEALARLENNPYDIRLVQLCETIFDFEYGNRSVDCSTLGTLSKSVCEGYRTIEADGVLTSAKEEAGSSLPRTPFLLGMRARIKTWVEKIWRPMEPRHSSSDVPVRSSVAPTLPSLPAAKRLAQRLSLENLPAIMTDETSKTLPIPQSPYYSTIMRFYLSDIDYAQKRGLVFDNVLLSELETDRAYTYIVTREG